MERAQANTEYRTENNEAKPASELLTELLGPQPTVVGIEGGPCGGKSTLVDRLITQAEEQGQEIYVIPEVATRHILNLAENGVSIADLAANDREGYLIFQAAVLSDINARIIEAKNKFAGTDTLIISDRLSNRPYVTPEEYQELTDRLGVEQNEILHRYVDKVIYLPSVAKVAPELYLEFQKTNAARYESVPDAQATCDRTLASVAAHPELYVIGDCRDFEIKMDRAASLVFSGDAEYETKMLPVDTAELVEWLQYKNSQGEVINQIEIVQSYHQTKEGFNYRLRQGRGADNETFYHLAVKFPSDYGSQETRRIISQQDYEILIEEECLGSLNKTRLVVLDNWQVWHCDYYEEQDTWVVEAEVTTPQELGSIVPSVEMIDGSKFDTKEFAQSNRA